MGLFMDAAQWDEIDKLVKQVEELSTKVAGLAQENNDFRQRVAALEEKVAALSQK